MKNTNGTRGGLVEGLRYDRGAMVAERIAGVLFYVPVAPAVNRIYLMGEGDQVIAETRGVSVDNDCARYINGEGDFQACDFARIRSVITAPARPVNG